MSKVATLQKQIEDLEQQIVDTRANHFFKCPTCKKKTQVKKLTLIREHWHVPPHGCTGGDYWKFDQYHVVCHKCSTANRVYDKRPSYKPERWKGDNSKFDFVREHESQFAERLDWYPIPRYNDTIDLARLRKEQEERRNRW